MLGAPGIGDASNFSENGSGKTHQYGRIINKHDNSKDLLPRKIVSMIGNQYSIGKCGKKNHIETVSNIFHDESEIGDFSPKLYTLLQ